MFAEKTDLRCSGVQIKVNRNTQVKYKYVKIDCLHIHRLKKKRHRKATEGRPICTKLLSRFFGPLPPQIQPTRVIGQISAYREKNEECVSNVSGQE